MDVEQNVASGFVDRDDIDCPYCERLKRVGQCRGLWRDGHRPDDVFGKDCFGGAADKEGKFAIADEFERIGPSLEGTALIPEQGESPADLVEKRSRLRQSSQLKVVRLERKRGNSHLRLRGCGKEQKKREKSFHIQGIH